MCSLSVRIAHYYTHSELKLPAHQKRHCPIFTPIGDRMGVVRLLEHYRPHSSAIARRVWKAKISVFFALLYSLQRKECHSELQTVVYELCEFTQVDTLLNFFKAFLCSLEGNFVLPKQHKIQYLFSLITHLYQFLWPFEYLEHRGCYNVQNAHCEFKTCFCGRHNREFTYNLIKQSFTYVSTVVVPVDRYWSEHHTSEHGYRKNRVLALKMRFFYFFLYSTCILHFYMLHCCSPF